MKIETKRLVLREMTKNDFDSLYAVLADSDIMQHYPYSFDDNRVNGWIDRNIERYRIFGFGLWAVCLKETGEMIGDCGLSMQNIGEVIKPEIGYHIRHDKQRMGYATEAAAAVRDWTFKNTPFNIIFSYMKYTNIPSANTAVSWGCHQVDEFKDDVNEITKVFAISRQTWEEICGGYKIIKLKERPELKEQAADWFHSKWGVPVEAYLESMEASLKGDKIQEWYLCLDGKKIIAGMGEIENDFHNRKDLSPNICAVFTEKEYRGLGIAGKLLNYVVSDNKARGISPLYLITDHVSFYERYGWEFLCMVQGDGEPDMTRMYIHR